MLEGLHDLHEYLPNDVLIHVIFIALAPLNQLQNISALAILHHDVNGLILFFYDPRITSLSPVVVSDDIRVLELSKNVDLRNELFFFFLRHFAIVEFFPDKYSAIGLPLDLGDHSEAA